MEITTISDIFDTALHSYEGGLSFDEYEKSLYLTKAQDIFYDEILGSFEAINVLAEKLDRLLFIEAPGPLIETPGPPVTLLIDEYGGIIFALAHRYRKILRETVTFAADSVNPIYQGKTVEVLEERLSEIQSSLANPFRKPDTNYALRAIHESTEATDTYGPSRVSIYVPKDTVITKYTVTYAIEPKPIILEDLPTGLSVRGINTQTAKEDLSFKDEDIDKIIMLAVGLAKQDIAGPAQTAAVQDQVQQ